MRELFEKHGYDVRLINEAHTSKRCSVRCCGGETKTFMQCTDTRKGRQSKERTVWRLVQCQNTECEWIHNRNRNVVFDLLRTAFTIPHDLPRPAYLGRPRKGVSYGKKKKRNSASNRSSRKRRSTPSTRGSDRAIGAAASSRQRLIRSDTFTLSPSGTAEPERQCVSRTREHRCQA
eukprot:ctg_1452.g345